MGIVLTWYHLILIPWNMIQEQNEDTCTAVSQTAFVGKVVLDFITSEIITTCNVKRNTWKEGFPISYLNFIVL